MIANLGFDAKISSIVDQLRWRKLERKRLKDWNGRRARRKPRHCVTASVELCPRQKAKRLKTAGG
jgi:hypothetical protein